MSNKLEDMVIMSQLYPDVYSQISPQQAGDGKTRRRRKKNKGGESSISGLKKRKLSPEQVEMLELSFGDEHKLESERKDKLAAELGLDPRQVAVWFQNRRTRWKNKKLEEEYSKLKAAHDGAILEKCRLESEVLKLKDQLGDAEKEIQRLSDGVSSNNSPSSSIEPPFFGEFGMESNYDNVFYLPESSYIVNGMEWMYM